MEVTIEKPGHYVFETKNGLDITNLHTWSESPLISFAVGGMKATSSAKC
jgi:hypothetical protein